MLLKRLNLVKMSISPKSLYKINEIPIKIPAGFFFVDIDKTILSWLRKGKGTQITKAT